MLNYKEREKSENLYCATGQQPFLFLFLPIWETNPANTCNNNKASCFTFSLLLQIFFFQIFSYDFEMSMGSVRGELNQIKLEYS